MHNLAVVVGSLRRESINRKLARALAKLGSQQFRFDVLDLSDVPLFNEDLLNPDPPEPVQRLKAAVKAADAILFVTPEYNRSFTPAIKNVIDWGSRPLGANSWAGKPASIIGISPGSIGTAVAQSQLRSVVMGLGMVVMGYPEIYLTWTPGMIDPDYNIPDDSTRQFLGKYLGRFDKWIDRVKSS